MNVFDIPFCEEYSQSLEFETAITRRFDLSEQRQARRLYPKRSFRLNFESKPADKKRLEDFFKNRKGDFESFIWRWQKSKSGSGLDYKCFFEASDFSQTVYPLGYASGPLSLCMIDDGNVLGNRFFIDDTSWSCEGESSVTQSGLAYQGVATMSQKGVLTPGQTYNLVAKLHGSSGTPPALNPSVASISPSQRYLLEGETSVLFVAQSEDFAIEIEQGAQGVFSEIALMLIPPVFETFDFDYNLEHQNEMIFANIKDEEFTFAANRQNLAPNPLRRWVLTFELTPSEAVVFEKFFIAQKGRYKAFYWNYEGERICVRFDSDKLDQKHYPLGYREIKIPIIEVLQ